MTSTYPIQHGDYIVIVRPHWSAIFRVNSATGDKVYFQCGGSVAQVDANVMWIPKEVYGDISPMLETKYPSMGQALQAVEPKRRLSSKQLIVAYETRLKRLGEKLDVMA